MGAWVCARCGLAPEGHSHASSACIYEPTYRPSVNEERVAVVTYLRNMSERGASRLSEYANAFADSIERGDHMR